MGVLDISALAFDTPERLELARSRKMAAAIAILFPAVAILLTLATIAQNGLNPTVWLEHGVLMALVVPGFAAMVFWCRRYIRPALRALRETQPIYVQDGCLVIQGQTFPVGADMVLRYDQSALELTAGGRQLGRFPAFFTRIRPLKTS